MSNMEKPAIMTANDAWLWAAMSTELRRQLPEHVELAGGGSPEQFARKLVALVRIGRGETRTWAPGDKLPSPPPTALSDVDGVVWLNDRDAGLGTYRMSAADRVTLAESTSDVEGVRAWPFLLNEEGPLTEHPPPGAAELDTLHLLFARYLRTDMAEVLESDTEAIAEVGEVARRTSGGEEVTMGFALEAADDALTGDDRAEILDALHPARDFAVRLARVVSDTTG